jgi:hypothetical protein
VAVVVQALLAEQLQVKLAVMVVLESNHLSVVARFITLVAVAVGLEMGLRLLVALAEVALAVLVAQMLLAEELLILAVVAEQAVQLH